jgi:hypothetical protein
MHYPLEALMTSLESLNTAAAAAGFVFVLSDDVLQEGALTDPNAARRRGLERRTVAERTREQEQSLSGLVNDLIGALRSRVPA